MAIRFDIRGGSAVRFDVKGSGSTSFRLDNVKVIVGGGGEAYTGEYTVTPKVYEQTVLPTKAKTMRDDVTVKKIPQYAVSNESGGVTLILGNEYMQGV